jgi:poly(3-hydroxybutyrate) depolymerase
MIRRHSIHSMVAALALMGGACSSSSSPSPGSGGSHGTGGASQGGKTGSGGSVQPGTGGSNGTGGRTGSGGAGTGGQSGSGGQPGSGGSGVGGTTNGTGGSSAPGGTTSQPGTGGRSATGGTTSQPGTGGAAGGNSGRDGGPATGGAGGGPAIDAGGGSGAAVPSTGCGKTPTLKNNPTQNTISGSRQFIVRWPTDYKNTTPYRLIFNLHGAGGSDLETSGNNYGLWSLSNGTTIFVSLSAVGGSWNATADTTYANDVLKAVEADLCIDTTRVMLEGFSMGGAMARVLGCASPGVFRAIVGHSAGGVTMPSTCQPIPYLGSLGLSDVAGNSQATQTDPFAKWNGCTMETLPTSPKGSHICTPYKGCPAADPVIWCSYDGGHTPSPTDSGSSTSWMPSVVWPFFSQF